MQRRSISEGGLVTNKTNWTVTRFGLSGGSKSDWPLEQKPWRELLRPHQRESVSVGRESGPDASGARGQPKKRTASSDGSEGTKARPFHASAWEGLGPTHLRKVRP